MLFNDAVLQNTKQITMEKIMTELHSFVTKDEKMQLVVSGGFSQLEQIQKQIKESDVFKDVIILKDTDLAVGGIHTKSDIAMILESQQEKVNKFNTIVADNGDVVFAAQQLQRFQQNRMNIDQGTTGS